MAHIHTEPGAHDFTTSAFIIRTDGPEPAVMLHRHRKYDMMMQFGGHIELDETPWQGALREIREESGYSPRQLAVLQPPGSLRRTLPEVVSHPLPAFFNTHPLEREAHFHSDLVYVMQASGPPLGGIQHGESDDIQQFTPSQLRDLPASQIYANTRIYCLFILEQLINSWEPVPATDWPA